MQDVSLLYNKTVTRQNGVNVKCSVTSTDDKILSTRSCDVQVYEPPGPIVCTQVISKENVTVNCTTVKVFPRALCHWSYNNADDPSPQPVTAKETRLAHHQEFTDGPDQDIFFRSSCKVTLTRQLTRFRSGPMTVFVDMFPATQGVDLSRTPEAVGKGQVVFNIGAITMRYPCPVCGQHCSRIPISIECSTCLKWTHRRCVPIDPDLMDEWSTDGLDFTCKRCTFHDGHFDVGASLERMNKNKNEQEQE